MPTKLDIIRLARKMRKNPTEAEHVMWHFLRDRNLRGWKFLRQHPIQCFDDTGKEQWFIADFYCSAAKLVVEMDGYVHLYNLAYDKVRDEMMAKMGITVLRFRNEEPGKDSHVLEKLKAELERLQSNR